jgi:hypothetical protein
MIRRYNKYVVFNLLSLERKARLSVNTLNFESTGECHEIQQEDNNTESDLCDTIFNPIASTL